ncbi:MAG: HVO_0476 family zinc finger protein [Methanomicrobiales archaeon]
MELICPTCNERTPHDVLRETDDVLVRCTVCGDVYRVPKKHTPTFQEVPIVVSHHEESVMCVTELGSDECCRVGEMVVAFCHGEPVAVEITGIETDTKRVESACTPDIRTLWSRGVEQVVVRVSIHEGARTRPVHEVRDGEDMIAVGETRYFGGLRARVTRIKLRDGALMKKEGWSAPARKIKRVFADRV